MTISEKKTPEKKIKFGTDGWRGIIADDFTYANLAKLGVRIAEYISSRGNNVCVGYDNRFLSPEYAEFFSAILKTKGVEVDLSDQPVPTPAVSRRVKETKSSLGVMITASHNPPDYNGIKIKEKYGGSARGELVKVIVKSINETEVDFDIDSAIYKGKKNSWIESYSEKLLSSLPKGDLTVAVDYMHGAASPYFKDIIEKKGYTHTGLRQNRDPLFGGVSPEPIPSKLGGLASLVKKSGAAIGFAFDGDGDRIAIIDESGTYHSMQRVLAVLAYNMLREGQKGRIIKTVAGTTLIDRICSDFDSSFSVVPIGFKNICPEMLKGDVLAAGEESGGLGFGDYIPERDSIYSAVKILALIKNRGKLFGRLWDEVRKKYTDSYYLREDFEINSELSKIDMVEKIKKKIGRTDFPAEIKDLFELDGIRINLNDGSWLLIRPSGTEPVIRVYAESTTKEAARRLIIKGRELVL